MKSLAVFFFGVSLLLLQTTVAHAQLPTNNLKMHLSADAGITSSGDSISVWADQSGNGNNATQSTLSKRPIYVASSLNGEPVLRFNGSNTFLTLPTAATLGIQNNDYEIFIVSRSASVNTNIEFLLGGSVERYELHLNGSAGARYIPTTSTYIDHGAIGDYSDTNAHSYNLRATSTYGTVTVDFTNTTISNVNAQTSDGGNIYLGIRGDNSFPLDGDIAEVLIYNTVLNTNARDSVESYLNAKYLIDPSQYSSSFTSASLEKNGTSSATFSAIVNAPFTTSYRVLWGTNSTVFTDSTSYTAGATGASTDTLSFGLNGLNSNTLYYAKMELVSSNDTLSSNVLPIYIDHFQVNGDSLSLWLAANIGFENKLNGDEVSVWYDISGNNNSGVVPSSSTKPTFATNSINGLPVISLGSTGAFDLPTTGDMGIHNSDYEIFAVAKKNGTDGLTLLGGYYNFSFSLDHNGYAFRFTDFDNFGNNGQEGDMSIGSAGTYSDNSPHVFNMQGRNQSGYVKVDYLTVGSDTSNSYWMRNNNPIGLGAGLISGSRFNYFKGEIAELIIYKRTLSESERHAVHTYLSDKYNLDLPLSTPTQSVSNLIFTSSGAGSAKIIFSPGNGVNNLVLVKEGSPVDELPIDSTGYSASQIFGEGSQIGTGNYVVNVGSDTSIVVTGLTQGETYYTKVFSYNNESGSGAEKYLTSEIDTASLVVPIVISVNSVSPTAFSNSNSLTTAVEVTFSGAMNTSTFGPDSSFVVRGSESGYHSGTFGFSESYSKVKFTSDSSFKAGELVTVNLTSKLGGTAGKAFADAQSFSFNIRTSASTGSFQKSGSLEQGFTANKTVVYDLNGDGWSDILTLDQNNYSISVWYANSDSTYASKVDFSASDSPTNFAVADMDGDGDEDILVSDSDGYSFKILANDGSNGFDFGTNFSLNNYSYSVSTGDLDSDGDLDVVVGIYDNISVLLNDGTGSLSAPTDYFINAGENVTEIVISDIDTDGDQDIIGVDYSNKFYTLLNSGDGTFESPVSYTTVNYPSALAVGDIDNDGDLDLVIPSNDTYYFHTYKNNGNGTFATQVIYQPTVYIEDIKLVDYDGDGDLDIISQPNGNYIQLYPNSGNGTFPSHSSFYVPNSVNSFAVADKDEDGDLDLYFATYDSLYIYENISFDPLTITGSEGWRLLASPIGTLIYSKLLKGLWTQGFTGASSSSGSSNVYYWDRSTNDNSSSNWMSISSASDSLYVGAGVLTYVFSDDNGPVAGDAGFPKTLEFPGSSPAQNLQLDSLLNANEDGWALLGNPFFLDVDWDNFNSQDLYSSVYVYDDSSSSWKTWNGSIGSLNDGVIPAFSGFFVQSEYDNPNLEIPLTAQIGYVENGSGGGEADKVRPKKTTPYFSLEFKSDSGFANKAWFQFSETGEYGIDGSDAYQLNPLSSKYVTLASALNDSTHLDINSLPVISEAYEVKLALQTTEAGGTHRISKSDFNLPEGWEITLHDSELEVSTDLSEPYVFMMASVKVKTQNIASPRYLASPQNPASPPGLESIFQPARNKQAGARFTLTITPATTVNGEPISDLPKTVELEQNYPNPFNPSSVIQFGVPELSKVRLEVFDILGRKVATLVNDEVTQPGRYSVQFHAGNLASGMYVYRLQIGNSILTKKMTLIK